MSFRDDGDALLARNTALEAENERLRAENERLQQPAETALVRTTPRSIAVADRVPWWRRGYTILLYVAAIAIAIVQGLL